MMIEKDLEPTSLCCLELQASAKQNSSLCFWFSCKLLLDGAFSVMSHLVSSVFFYMISMASQLYLPCMQENDSGFSQRW